MTAPTFRGPLAGPWLARTGLALALSATLGPTATAQESQFAADLRREGEAIAESCDSIKSIGGCAYTLFTSYPFHVAFGNIAPLNGFGFGGAFSERFTPNENWRLTFSADAVASRSGSNRVGGYVKFIHTPGLGVAVVQPGGSPARPRRLRLDTWAIDVFAQRTSLDTISFYGLGPTSSASDRSVFGQTQTLAGAAVVLPMSGRSWFGALNPALIGGVTSRTIDIRPGTSSDVPSIERLYTNATAPGLAGQDGFLELKEAIRLRPALPNGRLRFDYAVSAQQFITSSASRSSFRRATMDLRHEIPIYRGATSSGPPRDFNGPNECAATATSMACPAVQRSRNRTGAVALRALVSVSQFSSGNRVPFYLQPTIGGTDLNGERLLASFDDYRFRGPHLIAFQESIEHSVWGPIGVFAMAEQGKAAQRRADVDFAKLKTSAAVGLTLRAGGFPMITLSFNRGAEGNHVIAWMNSSLLGGSGRPSLH